MYWKFSLCNKKLFQMYMKNIEHVLKKYTCIEKKKKQRESIKKHRKPKEKLIKKTTQRRKGTKASKTSPNRSSRLSKTAPTGTHRSKRDIAAAMHACCLYVGGPQLTDDLVGVLTGPVARPV